MDSGKTTALADCLLLWGSSILFVEKKEGKERGQTNRETGGKTACDSWDPAHPAWDPKVETRADGADYAGCGTGRLFFLSGRKRKNYLIDGGSSSVDAAGRYRLEPFLKFRGVKRLDYVWVTHGDVDHLNAVEELLERRKYGVEIQYLIFPEQKYWDERLIKLCNLAEEAGTKVRVMEMDTIFLSGKLKMRCLWPGEGEPSENGNENSLVLHLQYGKITMLFTGDLENTGEELLAERIKNLRKKGELPACYDLLKVGHHGSRNATGEELLEVIRPRAAFCSSGKENRYGHPHAETLERLAKWGVSLYNTKDRGAVSMYTDGREYGIQSP